MAVNPLFVIAAREARESVEFADRLVRNGCSATFDQSRGFASPNPLLGSFVGGLLQCAAS